MLLYPHTFFYICGASLASKTNFLTISGTGCFQKNLMTLWIYILIITYDVFFVCYHVISIWLGLSCLVDLNLDIEEELTSLCALLNIFTVFSSNFVVQGVWLFYPETFTFNESLTEDILWSTDLVNLSSLVNFSCVLKSWLYCLYENVCMWILRLDS